MNISPVNYYCNNSNNPYQKPNFKQVFNVACVQVDNVCIQRGRKYISVINKAVKELKLNEKPFAKKFWAKLNPKTLSPRAIQRHKFFIIEGPPAEQLSIISNAIKKGAATVDDYRNRADDIVDSRFWRLVKLDETEKPTEFEVVIRASANGKKGIKIDDLYLLGAGKTLPIQTNIFTKSYTKKIEEPLKIPQSSKLPPSFAKPAVKKHREPLNPYPDWPAVAPKKQIEMPKGADYLDFG